MWHCERVRVSANTSILINFVWKKEAMCYPADHIESKEDKLCGWVDECPEGGWERWILENKATSVTVFDSQHTTKLTRVGVICSEKTF